MKRPESSKGVDVFKCETLSSGHGSHSLVEQLAVDETAPSFYQEVLPNLIRTISTHSKEISMRLCRYEKNGTIQVGFYDEARISPLQAIASQSGVTVPKPIRCLRFSPVESSRHRQKIWRRSSILSPKTILQRSLFPHAKQLSKFPYPTPKKSCCLRETTPNTSKRGVGGQKNVPEHSPTSS